ncbi:hypothetical protein CO2235_MP80188 [Cupriavidus oxalaticus]|uniref:HpaB/PvcC/4-BUDH N-terminal domain-containing protein n=1 Tax=Cupriavidus oxalaticus TaxID=96344 RepID=A0A375FN09_9BURK|nr:hypothetical protein CO2235_U840006 [Cupriavidus oxalaticus]SPC24308.1 hypothetical protein CO2235_MP80188 [Cupriavidus oxalaticus]
MFDDLRSIHSRACIPFTGQEYLDSLDDGREVWIYGERVGNVANHPAFRNSARIAARCHCVLAAMRLGLDGTLPGLQGRLPRYARRECRVL